MTISNTEHEDKSIDAFPHKREEQGRTNITEPIVFVTIIPVPQRKFVYLRVRGRQRSLHYRRQFSLRALEGVESVRRWVARVYSTLMSGKEMTAYHLSIFSFVLLTFHLPYVFSLPLNWHNWLETMSLYFLFLVLWDFLWFVMNPNYSIRKFNSQHIWWHRKWALKMPVDYINSAFLSFFLLLPLVATEKASDVLAWWCLNTALFVILTLITCLILYLIPVTRQWIEGQKENKPSAPATKKV